jgi:choline-sulfatase
MSFLEPAAAVPLIVSLPSRFPAARVKTPASLADLAPTLCDLARPGLAADLARPVDGRSLLGELDGSAPEPAAAVWGEYLAEGVVEPMVMIRRGRFKFIACPGDPDQLFDLDADPEERENLAASMAHEDVRRRFRAEAERRWDFDALRLEVTQSQRARLMLFEALKRGTHFPWDFQPLRDASEQYTRNHMDVTARDQLSRFPPAPEPVKKGR